MRGWRCLSQLLVRPPRQLQGPVCKLYKVAGAEIPIRSDKLFVFDKACPAKLVPVTAPTHSAPRGLIASAVTKTTKAKAANSKDTKAKAVESKAAEPKNTMAKTTETKNIEAKAAEAKDSKVTETKGTQAKAVQSQVAKAKDTQVKAVESKDTKNQQAKATVVYGKPAATSTKCQTQAKQTANANTNEVSGAQKSN